MDITDISKDLGVILKNKMDDIIISICMDHNLDEDEILKKYSPNLLIDKEKMKMKRKRKILPKEECCLGRKQFGEQCTRRKKPGSDFCGSHSKNLPYGMIEDDKQFLCKTKGKRGRKKKNLLEGNEDYIPTWIDEELGDLYLVDKDNIVYLNNEESPKIIGKKNIETGEIEDIDMSILSY